MKAAPTPSRLALLFLSFPLLQVTCDSLAAAVNIELQNLALRAAADVVDRILTNLLGFN